MSKVSVEEYFNFTESKLNELMIEEIAYSDYDQMTDWLHEIKEYVKRLEHKEQIIEQAISAFIGQSGEYDGYLACCGISKSTYQVAQVGDMVRDYDELIDWYKKNYPEELGWVE